MSAEDIIGGAFLFLVLFHPQHIAHYAVGNKDAVGCQFQSIVLYFECSLADMRACHLQAIVM